MKVNLISYSQDPEYREETALDLVAYCARVANWKSNEQGNKCKTC